MVADASTPAKVLVVDDLKGVRQVLNALLTRAGYQVIEADNGQTGLDLIRAEQPDVVLLDVRMPGLDGFEVLERAGTIDPDLPIVMITAYGDVDTAVDAMHRGAHHYLSKPFHHAEVLAIVERAAERRRLSRQVRSLRDQLAYVTPLTDLLGTSEPIQALLIQLDRLAITELPVLVAGQPGSGTELLARAIHARSARRHGPFVAVDCGAVPTELLDSELLGHERDAFPGADRQRRGQLEMADGGTLFLDDVAALSPSAQAALVQFLHHKRIQRVGGDEELVLDVRVIVATAADLEHLVEGGLFRRDLYGRFAEATLTIPPLRDRPDDIVFLVKHLLDATNAELGKHVQGPTPEALDLLVAHPWPGNARELRHVVKRAVLLADTHITPAHLPFASSAPEPAAAPDPPDDPTMPLAERTRRAAERVERQAIADALRHADGNKRQAAQALGIGYKTLLNKIKKLKLQPVREPAP